jgi:histidyl-tRNA synthetase
MLQKPRGTRDFLPDEMEKRRYIEGIMRETSRRWGYREVCTPEFEELELFTIRSGEGIIQEMYVFEDKGGRKLALRPELTAPVLRIYVNEGRSLSKPLRWCYFSDCFRYERPQKGRYRQFWQFGVELIGADTAMSDAEPVMLAGDILKNTGLPCDMHVGHLSFVKKLLEGVDPSMQRAIRMCLDKKDFAALEHLLETNGFSELKESLIALVESRSLAEVFEITGDIPEKSRIEEVFSILDSSGIPYTLNTGIARGLDYYTGIVFEAFAENLGAENQIMGGGTYRLAHLFGGEDTPSSGFAIGFDRVMVALGEIPAGRDPGVGLVIAPGSRKWALEVAQAFRNSGIRAETDLSGKGIGAQMAQVSRHADFAVIIGAREAECRGVTLKNLQSGLQNEMTVDDAVAEVKRCGACR